MQEKELLQQTANIFCHLFFWKKYNILYGH